MITTTVFALEGMKGMKIGSIYFSDTVFLAGYGLWWQIGWPMSQYHTVFFMNERYLQFGALGGFSKKGGASIEYYLAFYGLDNL